MAGYDKTVNLKLFSGKAEEFQIFRRNMKDVFVRQKPPLDYNNKKDWAQCCSIVRQHCTQQVFDTLRLMPEEVENDWNKFMAYIQKIYAKKESYQLQDLLRELVAVKQQEGASLQQYATKIEDICRKIKRIKEEYDFLEEEELEQDEDESDENFEKRQRNRGAMGVSALVQGLRSDELKKQMIIHKITTWPDALAQLQHIAKTELDKEWKSGGDKDCGKKKETDSDGAINYTSNYNNKSGPQGSSLFGNYRQQQQQYGSGSSGGRQQQQQQYEVGNAFNTQQQQYSQQ